jgi:Transposase DNA-binding
MPGLPLQAAPPTWAVQNFATIELSDVRRVRRVVTIAEAMATQPGRSIPQLFATPYEVKAAYTLFRQAEATPDTLQAGHRAAVKAEMKQPGVYLLIEDTTTLSWSGKQPIPGLGPVGSGAAGLQGFQLHSVLAVRWPVGAAETEASRRPPLAVLGVCDQQYEVRTPRPADERKGDSRARQQRARESQVWEEAGERIGAAPRTPDLRWVRVCDRGADIYEQLQSCVALGHGFVIRAAQDRAILDPQSGHRADRLFVTARAVAALGEFELELRARPNQPARRARLQVGATAVGLCAPRRPGHRQGSLPPLQCTVVRVWEVDAPAGVVPLEWILLCDVPVTTFAQALECALQYAARWVIEEYHKALKSGLGAERLQLETAAGLMAAIAIMSVVALRLIELRERVRLTPTAPAEEAGLEPLELEILRLKSPTPITTVQAVALAIGRLGGHLNRRSDGLPGWQTLWRGMSILRTLVEGVRLSHQLHKFG